MHIKQKITGVLLTSTLLTLFPLQTAFASGGVIYISPSSSNLQVGTSETVSLRINPSTTINGVQATITFNASQIRLNSVSTSGSPFSAQLQKSIGSNSISLALGDLSGGVSSDSLIATMNFTALTSSGSTTLAISNANATSSSTNTYTNPSVSDGIISLTVPPLQQPSRPSPVRSISSYAPPKGTATTPTLPNHNINKVTPLVAPHISTSNVVTGLTTATLTVESNQQVIIHAIYGTSANSLTSTTSTTDSTKAAILKLGWQSPLTPGTTYYYQVIAVSSNGARAETHIYHFTTRGYTVAVTVLGNGNRPIANQKVTLHSRAQTVLTNSNGVATFTNVAPGEHHLLYRTNNRTYSAIVYVNNPAINIKTNSTVFQTAAVILPVSRQSAWDWSTAIIALLSVTVLVLATLLLRPYKRKLLVLLRSHIPRPEKV